MIWIKRHRRPLLAALSVVALVLAVLSVAVMSREQINQLGTTLLGLAVVAGAAFLLLYSLLARWWESREGWYLFVSSAILTEILAYNYAAIHGWFLLTDPVVRELVRLAVYGQVFVVMAWRGLLLIQAQAESWRARKATQMDTEPKHR